MSGTLKNAEQKKASENNKYQNTRMNREMIIKRFREQGFRITKQRLVLLDVILEQDCASCKEIIFQASRKDKKIGTATVYRMVNILEDIGAVSRKITYPCESREKGQDSTVCTVIFDDHTACRLNKTSWDEVIEAGLKACGYLKKRKMVSVNIQPDKLKACQ